MLKKLLIPTIFAIAMGFLEGAVVIYLRELYYPDGFTFPLKISFAPHIALTELAREFATIIMLISIGILVGKNFSERFAYFIYCFAVWDIFYYVFLKLILNWPESFLTWDVLFLIPAMWVGPVIAPVILSLTMILFAMVIIYFSTISMRRIGKVIESTIKVKIIRREWLLLIIGSIMLIINFIWDYCRYIFQHISFSEIFRLPKEEFYSLSSQYIPQSFNWWIFLLGEGILLLAIILFYRRNYLKLSSFP